MRNGQTVNVKAFTAVVVEAWHSETATTHVRDANGNDHYVFDSQLEAASPFIDGRKYVDDDGDVFTYLATGTDAGKPGWQEVGFTVVHDYDYASRPIREYGAIVEEE